MNLTQFIDQRRPQWQELQALLEQVEGSGLRSLGPEGAVLVRPDGFIAWRRQAAPPAPERELAAALDSLLGG